ncbi:MAG: hypothetical protein ACRDUX_30425, partial [Mycobacterium sp.]
VQVVMHNTLAASDYALLNENDFTPKPNYWAALLWHRFMGSTVLDSGVPIQQGLHLYVGTPNGCAAVHPRCQQLDDPTVRLNGQPLGLGADDPLPALTGATTEAGDLHFARCSDPGVFGAHGTGIGHMGH